MFSLAQQAFRWDFSCQFRELLIEARDAVSAGAKLFVIFVGGKNGKMK